jgi:predicted DNA-binding protein
MGRSSTFNFRLPSGLKSRLDQFCSSRGMSKADLCVAAVTQFLDEIENLDRANLVSRVYPMNNPPAEKPTQHAPRRSAGA